MACPQIKITVTRGFFNPGGLNPSYTYNSGVDVQVVSGISTTPLQGTIELYLPTGNVTYNLNNPTNSFTHGNFILLPSQLYDASLAVVNLTLNGNCTYNKIVNLAFELSCNQVLNGIGDQISITETCIGEFVIGQNAILGCTDPNSITYNPDATVDDGSCDYEGVTYGCTDPDSYNYDPFAIADDGSCIDKVFGCIDPDAVNYNSEANTSDGSCLYNETNFILGCTNPLGSNYNPLANFNDGSCIFLSGCTNPDFDNYNPLAALDDGSCKCSKVEHIFTLNGETNFTFISSGDTICDYYFEFDYRVNFLCEYFLNFYQNQTDKTIIEIINDLKIYSEVRSSDIDYYRQIEFDVDTTSTSFNFGFTQCQNDDYEIIKMLIAEELGEKCPDDIDSLLVATQRKARLKIPIDFLNKPVQVGIYSEGFSFLFSLRLDNLKLFKICHNEIEECVIIPYNFGFRFEDQIQNKKANGSIKNEKLVLNSKQLDLKINILKFIKSDVIKYVNKYEHLLNDVYKNLTDNKLEKQFINTQSCLTDYTYYHQNYLYEQYLTGFKYCSAKSKELDYKFLFDILDKIGDNWVNLINPIIPSTAIWKEHTRYYTNLIFHQQKFKYKNYLLITASGPDSAEISMSCEYKTKNECNTIETFEAVIDKTRYDLTGFFVDTSDIAPMNFSNTNYGAGRLFQYSKDNEVIVEYNYPNQLLND